MLINEAQGRLPSVSPVVEPYSNKYGWALAGRKTWFMFPLGTDKSLEFPVLTASIVNPGMDINIQASLESIPTEVTFWSGDGGGVTCGVIPTDSDICGFKYVESSKNESGGVYTASVVVKWEFKFRSSDGATVDIDPLELTAEFPLKVATESTWITSDGTIIEGNPPPK
jgi:hypothetical protein